MIQRNSFESSDAGTTTRRPTLPDSQLDPRTEDDSQLDAALSATAARLPGYNAWQRFADGEITSAELDADWARDQEAAEDQAWAEDMEARDARAVDFAAAEIKQSLAERGSSSNGLPAWVPNRRERRAKAAWLALPFGAESKAAGAKWRYLLDQHSTRALRRLLELANTPNYGTDGMKTDELVWIIATEPLASPILPVAVEELRKRMGRVPVRFDAREPGDNKAA